jgi:hypothetical protein
MAAATLRMPLRTSIEKLPIVTGIVRDFGFRLYFRAQRLSWRQRLRCVPMLFLAETFVYRADAVVERAKDVDLGLGRSGDDDTVRRYRATFAAYKMRFEELLRRKHAYNEAVARQLDFGEEYLYLENKVTSNGAASHAELVRLAELRPFDLRMLHGIVFALLDRPVDNDLLDLLWPVEVLSDIGDDLKTYYSDVDAGHFNIYDSFLRFYGAAGRDQLQAEIDRYEQIFRVELAKFPADRQAELATICTRRYRPLVEVFPEPRPLQDSRVPQPEGNQ